MEKTLTVNSKKQLVDLNEDLVNFHIQLKVTPQEKGEFHAAIVKQTDLDSGNIEYQKFSKPFAANIENTDNNYQNHFLCLKADNDIPVKVQIQRRGLGRTPEPEPIIPEAPPSPMPTLSKKAPTGFFTMKNIILLIVVIGIGVGIYFMWFGGSKASPACTITEIPTAVGSPDTSGLLNKLNALSK